MTNILTFKGKSGRCTDTRFLQDCGETLDFGTDGDGRFEFNEPTLTSAEYSAINLDNDWSNQELADLFRVKRLLNAAGVICDIDRGLTDEGDPWCVFCDGDGEVFIHFCRIGRLYVLDSPSVEKPLRGANFNALVSDFTNRAVPKTEADSAPENNRHVLHFHRDRKVRLHPSALLSALIWTLFLASEELVLMTNAKKSDLSGDDAADGSDSLAPVPGVEQANVIADASHLDGQVDVLHGDFLDFEVTSPQASVKYPDTEIKLGDASFKDMQGQQGLGFSINAYAIGLSTIALAYGIMSARMWEDDRKQVLAALEQTDFESLLSDEAIADPADAGPRPSDGTFLATLFEAILSDEISSDLAILRDSVREALEIAKNTGQDANGTTDSIANLFAFQKTIDGAALLFSAPQEEAFGPSDVSPELSDQRDAERADAVTVWEDDGSAAAPSGARIANLVLDNQASDAIANIFGVWQTRLYEGSINNTQVYASFDLATRNDDTAAQLIEFVSSTSGEPLAASGMPETSIDFGAPGAPASSSKLQMFDDKAQAFMNVLLSRADNIDMLYHDGDLILIDLGAFKTEGARTYTMSWEFEDGSVVSTVGLRADFEAFDLIT